MRRLFTESHPWIMQALGGVIAVIIMIPIAAFVFVSVINSPSPQAAERHYSSPSAPGGANVELGGGAPNSGAQSSGSTGSASTNTKNPTWTTVHSIFSVKCTPCHIGGVNAGLNLDTYASALKGGATSAGGVVDGAVIKAGNANGSYLYQAISGTMKVGARMPLGGTPLDAAELKTVYTWIQQGAKQ